MLRCLICVWVMSCAAHCLAESDTNLLRGGDFETADATGWAEGWYRPKGMDIRRLEEAGNHFARLHVTKTGDSAVTQQEMPIDPSWKALTLSVRVRYDDIKQGPKGWNDGRVLVMFRNAAGKDVGKQIVMNWTGASAEWRTQSVSGLVPPDAAKVKIQLALFYVNNGQLDIDDVVLSSVEPATVRVGEPGSAPQSSATTQPLPYRALDTDFTAAQIEGKSVAGWSIMAGSPRVEQENDKSFVRLDVEHEGDTVQLRNYVPLYHGWGKLQIAARVRYKGVQFGGHGWQSACIIAEFLDADGKRISAAPQPLRWKGSSKEGWIEETRDVVIPMGATKLKLDPALLQVKAGTLDLASITVTITENRADMVNADLLPDAWKPAMSPHWIEKTTTRTRLCMNGVWKIRPIGLIPGDPKQITAGLIQHPPMPTATAPGLGWGYTKLPSTFPGSKESATDPIFPETWQGVNWSNTGAVWFQRDMDIPADWQGKRIVLTLDTIQSQAAVFVGDKLVGSAVYPAGQVDLTDAVTPGQSATVTILVIAKPFSEATIHAMNPDELYLASSELTQRGICGDIYLVAEPAGARITDVQMRPSLRQKQLGLHLQTVDAAGKSVKLRVIASFGGKIEKQWTSQAMTVGADGGIDCSMPWLADHLWDIDEPNLYDADVSLLDDGGRVIDEVRQRFGFRELWLDGRDIMLNGSPIHWRVTKIGNNFAGRSKPQMAGMFRRMRELGFNCLILDYDVYPGSAPSYEPMFQAADETGTILVATIPNLLPWKDAQPSPDARQKWEVLTNYSIRVAANHPSVLAYATNHNRLGYKGSVNPYKLDGKHVPISKDPAFAEKREVATGIEAYIRAADPTREVYHHSAGNFGAWETNNCYLNWMPMQERADYLAYWNANGVKPVFLTEFGMPFVATWGRFHGPGVYRPNTQNESLFIEFAAALTGARAYELNDIHAKYVDDNEASFAKKGYADWAVLTNPWMRHSVEWNYVDIQAMTALQTFPAMRTYGISGLLPWDFKSVADWTDQTPKTVTLTEPAEQWTEPGLHPDYAPGFSYAFDQTWFSSPASESYKLTSLAAAYRKVNADVLGWIAGRPGKFTEQTHLFEPGEKIVKQVIVLNDLRRELNTSYEVQVRVGQQTIAKLTGKVRIGAGRQQRDPITFELPADAAGDGAIHLTLHLPDGKTSEDEFTFSVLAPAPKVGALQGVVLWDPKGDTDKSLKQIGVNLPRTEGKIAEDVRCLVVGREALSVEGAAPDIQPLLARGGRVVVFEQTADVLSYRLGFRVATPSLRNAFVRAAGHSLLQGVDDQMLRDWNGEATLISPQLQGLPAFEDKYPTSDWLGFHNTHVWKVNNWGQVASVVIEKPQTGDFLALIDGGFDLQYSPLLLSRQGAGQVLFCQMDVSGRTEESQAAERLLANIMNWAGEKQQRVPMEATYVGDEATQALIGSLGAQVKAGRLPGAAVKQGVWVCGPGMGREQLRAALPAISQSQGTFVFLFQPPENLAVFAPHITTAAARLFGDLPGENQPAEMLGVGPAEMHLRGRTPITAISAAEGAGAWRSQQGSVAVATIGGARLVFLQIDPRDFDYTKPSRSYVKLTHNRTHTLLSRVLANVGVTMRGFLADYWNAPVSKSRIDLAGATWEAAVDPGNKLTFEKAATASEGWRKVNVPGELEEYQPWSPIVGRFWYRVKFDVPADLLRGVMELTIGRVDDEDNTYLNGQFIGHVGQDTHPQTYYKQQRQYKIPAGLLKAKDNVLVIEGTNIHGPSGIIDGPVGIAPQSKRWKGSYYLDNPVSTDDPYRYSRW